MTQTSWPGGMACLRQALFQIDVRIAPKLPVHLLGTFGIMPSMPFSKLLVPARGDETRVAAQGAEGGRANMLPGAYGAPGTYHDEPQATACPELNISDDSLGQIRPRYYVFIVFVPVA